MFAMSGSKLTKHMYADVISCSSASKQEAYKQQRWRVTLMQHYYVLFKVAVYYRAKHALTQLPRTNCSVVVSALYTSQHV
eukprot:6996-Heterococcus_DN1.PRE.2